VRPLHLGVALILLESFVASLSAQAVNDACAAATSINGPAPILGSNVGATTGPDPVPACAPMTDDVWYAWTAPCNGTYTASTCAAATNFGTVLAVWGAPSFCTNLVPIACSDVCIAGPHLGAAVTFQATVGSAYRISVGANGVGSGTFELSIALGSAMSLTFFGGGTGSLGWFVAEGPANGIAFVAITLNPGQFPFGWFLGIDIGWLELLNELSSGWPFVLALQPCGSAQVGPFVGLPTGLQAYGVAVGLPPGSTVPAAISAPVIGVVP
jgi:hypothetical protein